MGQGLPPACRGLKHAAGAGLGRVFCESAAASESGTRNVTLGLLSVGQRVCDLQWNLERVCVARQLLSHSESVGPMFRVQYGHAEAC